ncbi:hypothetical protein FWH30_02115 [Microgenomates group bacterium]|nr:hypothetical protein [Microgenomates group bacterium]
MQNQVDVFSPINKATPSEQREKKRRALKTHQVLIIMAIIALVIGGAIFLYVNRESIFGYDDSELQVTQTSAELGIPSVNALTENVLNNLAAVMDLSYSFEKLPYAMDVVWLDKDNNALAIPAEDGVIIRTSLPYSQSETEALLNHPSRNAIIEALIHSLASDGLQLDEVQQQRAIARYTASSPDIIVPFAGGNTHCVLTIYNRDYSTASSTGKRDFAVLACSEQYLAEVARQQVALLDLLPPEHSQHALMDLLEIDDTYIRTNVTSPDLTDVYPAIFSKNGDSYTLLYSAREIQECDFLAGLNIPLSVEQICRNSAGTILDRSTMAAPPMAIEAAVVPDPIETDIAP